MTVDGIWLLFAVLLLVQEKKMTLLKSDPVPMDVDGHGGHDDDDDDDGDDDDDDDDDGDDGCYYYGTLVSPGSAIHDIHRHCMVSSSTTIIMANPTCHSLALCHKTHTSFFSYRAIMVLPVYPLMSG